MSDFYFLTNIKSQKTCIFKKNPYLCTRNKKTTHKTIKNSVIPNIGWPVRLSVRTQDFHS